MKQNPFTLLTVGLVALVVSPPFSWSQNETTKETPKELAPTPASAPEVAPDGIPSELRDPAFDRFVDLRALGQAWARLDAATLADIALQMTEGEGALKRPHKAISAEKVLDMAIRVASRQRDKETLDRLTKALEARGNKDRADQLALASTLASSARAAEPTVSVSVGEMSPESYKELHKFFHAVNAARVAGDVKAFVRLKDELEDLVELTESQRDQLRKMLAQTQASVPKTDGDETVETLNKLTAASRDFTTNYGTYRNIVNYRQKGAKNSNWYAAGFVSYAAAKAWMDRMSLQGYEFQPPGIQGPQDMVIQGYAYPYWIWYHVIGSRDRNYVPAGFLTKDAANAWMNRMRPQGYEFAGVTTMTQASPPPLAPAPPPTPPLTFGFALPAGTLTGLNSLPFLVKQQPNGTLTLANGLTFNITQANLIAAKMDNGQIKLVASGAGNLISQDGAGLISQDGAGLASTVQVLSDYFAHHILINNGANILNPGNITGSTLISPGNVTGSTLISPGNVTGSSYRTLSVGGVPVVLIVCKKK